MPLGGGAFFCCCDTATCGTVGGGGFGKPFWGIGGDGMGLIVDKSVFENQMRVLQAAATMDGELGARLRNAVAAEIKAARDRVVKDIRFANGDPRDTAKAVRRIAYKKILGGNINILDRKKASGSQNDYEAPRKLRPGQRGGNRMIRSVRTHDILHYGPLDRGWILRIVNSGTKPRYANGRNGKWSRSGNKTFEKLQESGDYFRGSISARNFFGSAGGAAMEKAMANLQTIIEEEFNKLFE